MPDDDHMLAQGTVHFRNEGRKPQTEQSFDRHGDLVEQPKPRESEVKRLCWICGKELTHVGVGVNHHERCPLHGSRGVPA